MRLFKNITAYFPKDGDDAEAMLTEAYASDRPAFISLKSDPVLSRSITGAISCVLLAT